MRLHSFLIICISCCLLVSCKAKKKLVNTPKDEAQLFIAKSLKERPLFKKMSIRGKARVNYPGKGVSMSANYRISMVNEDLIWISISKLGIEGMRALVTRDSVKVIDRVNNQFFESDYGIVRQLTGLEGDFDMVQDLILGNLNLLPPESRIYPGAEDSPNRVFTGKEAGISFTYTIDPGTFKLLQMEAKDESQDLHSTLAYGEFRELGNTRLPYEGKVQMYAPEAASISFTHSRVEVNPDRISTKFNVPDHYERVAK